MSPRQTFALAMVFALLGVSAWAVEPPGQPLLYSVPFQAADGRCLIYRIPALCVASRSQALLAFAEGRVEKRRAMGNIDLVLRRSLDGGQTWEPRQVVADLGGDFCGNPCVVEDPRTSRLWLACTRSQGAATEEQIAAGTAPGTQVWITSSDDDGVTWAKPRDISAMARKADWGWYGTGPGNGLFLADASPAARGDDPKKTRTDDPKATRGRLLFGAYHSQAGVYRAHCVYSDDGGVTWQIGSDAADDSSEPQLTPLGDGVLMMNARNTAEKGAARHVRISRDRGQTWQPAKQHAPLWESRCQGCIVRMPRPGARAGHDLIFTQPIDRKRRGVHAWLSEDEGQTWPHAQPLWRGPSAYTALARLPDGQVGALLECGERDTYEQIVFVKFSAAWLKTRPAPPAAGQGAER